MGGLFGDAFDYLNEAAEDISCRNDGNSPLNHWKVTLGFLIAVVCLIIILAITTVRRHLKVVANSGGWGGGGWFKVVANSGGWDGGGWEEVFGKDDTVDFMACHKNKKYFLAHHLSLMALACRKDPVIHYGMTLMAMMIFISVLLIFQRFPQSQYKPMACISTLTAIYLGVYYYITITKPKPPVPNADPVVSTWRDSFVRNVDPDEKKYYKHTPRNVYQDLSVPIIHPILIFLIQISLASIYIMAVFDEKFPPCINDTAAYTLYLLAAFLKSMYYGVEQYHNERHGRDARNLWINTYDMLIQKDSPPFILAWASSPPMEGNITKLSWYVRLFLDTFTNWVVWAILMFFMVIQAANSDLQDFVLNFVAVDFILRLDDYSTFGHEGFFCIVRFDRKTPFELPTTQLEDVELRFKEKNEKLTNENEELRNMMLEKDIEYEELRSMILELKDKIN